MYESMLLFMAALLGIASAPLTTITEPGGTQPFGEVVSHTVPSDKERASVAPFMTLPYRQQDVPREILGVNEGWYYSPEEMSIHGKALHRGIDADAPRGTPVTAVADGYAVRSFQLSTTDQTYQGKSVGLSLGEFVEVWHPKQRVYTLYGHMESASDAIPYVTSEQLAQEVWEPTGIYVNTETFIKNAVPVKRGQIIGYVGDSGIGWGYSDTFNTRTQHVNKRDYGKFPSWDKTHVHLEVYTRSPDGRIKQTRLDPFGLYDYIDGDRNPYNTRLPSADTLWLTNNAGQPKYADER